MSIFGMDKDAEPTVKIKKKPAAKKADIKYHPFLNKPAAGLPVIIENMDYFVDMIAEVLFIKLANHIRDIEYENHLNHDTAVDLSVILRTYVEGIR
jgi:hypothetical protein